jgi:hypothetical protein
MISISPVSGTISYRIMDYLQRKQMPQTDNAIFPSLLAIGASKPVANVTSEKIFWLIGEIHIDQFVRLVIWVCQR